MGVSPMSSTGVPLVAEKTWHGRLAHESHGRPARGGIEENTARMAVSLGFDRRTKKGFAYET